MPSLSNLVLIAVLAIGSVGCYREPTEPLEGYPMLPPRLERERPLEVLKPRTTTDIHPPTEATHTEESVVEQIANEVGGLTLQPTSRANSTKDTMYDLSIRKWSGIYTPQYPWCWNKAQIKAESAFRSDAVSPVGAKGLGQFMPATWTQMVRELNMGDGADAFNPALNIQATTYYMAKLRANFKTPRPEWDKHSLAMASYNAGLGNILKAQAYTGSIMYKPMIDNLHRVTGHHHLETKNYVTRIWGYVAEYEREGLCD